MAWSMPTSGQWNPNIGGHHDGNMGSYSAEQWAALQQQNWQQWAQWQQQYATWQSQYGNKYVEQMQAMQTINSMPPLPPVNTAPPPAPPPPDKPPPPPHENNQPLYGNTQKKALPVSASGLNNVKSNNITDSTTGNNHNGPYSTDAHLESMESSGNSEALRTLAEEEKAFDIQFQKWEEEIEKWKKANVNHPDKKAYEEYEQRFESCRARLLERRQQMKLKRAKLLGTAPQASNSAARQNLNVPPPVHTPVSTGFAPNKDQGFVNPPPQSFHNSSSQIPQFSNAPQQDYTRENNKNIDPYTRYESYANTHTGGSNSFSNNSIPTASFLPRNEPSKGIPGLDLVPAVDKLPNKIQEVIDITCDPMEKQLRSAPQGPDYSKISKGINNILGDEKIMNILSMVRGQSQQTNNMQSSYVTNTDNTAQNNYWERNENYNDNYRMGQNLPYEKQQGDYSLLQESNQPSKYAVPPQQKLYENPQNTLPQDQYYDKNQHFNSHSVPPRMQHPGAPVMQQNVRPNMPLRSLLDPILPQSEYTSGTYDRRGMQNELHQNIKQNVPIRPPPVRSAWIDDPLFTPSIIVEYEHKPLRLKARDFIEPVHTFDYNHQSKDSDVKKKDFEKEGEELFVKHPRISEKEDRFSERHKDLYYRDHERTLNRAHVRDFRDDHYPRSSREEHEERRRYDDDINVRRYEDRRQDDREKYRRREDIHRERDRDREDMFRERERDLERNRDRDRESERFREKDRDMYKDRYRDYRRSKSRDQDNRKRGHSKDSEINSSSAKKPKDAVPELTRLNEKPRHTIMVDDILELPGRQMRPEKIVIILRGPPGSGKSYLAKLIRDREAENGGTVRVMSIDDYFMQEGEIEEKDPTTGKVIKKPSLKYEYDESQEENYLFSLKRAFKRSLTDGFFTFLIYDAVNDQLRAYADIWNYARQCGFQVYICTMDLDPQVCFKRNIHNRKLEEIQAICTRFFPTPDHHIQLDPTTLLQSASIPDVQMEDAQDAARDVPAEDAQETEVNSSFTSKWEKMDDAAQLARLDGTSRPLRPSQLSMEDYLQLDDWKPNTSKPGKKTVRWADIEERRQQEKMRAIGFVVGQTDWNRMTDPTMGSSALTQTKYIERVKRS